MSDTPSEEQQEGINDKILSRMNPAQRFSYGMTRPYRDGMGVPLGSVLFSKRAHPDYPEGIIDYPEPLPAAAVEKYGLVELTIAEIE